MNATLVGWLLGTLLGVRHALEPDHLAAVSTLVAESRNPRSSAWLGVLWGVGHSLGLLLLGGALALAQQRLDDSAALSLELAVACMLCLLGARAMRNAWAGARGGVVTVHNHGGHSHVHRAPDGHMHVAGWTLMQKPLMVGLMHGFAGSGALIALVASHQPTLWQQMLYIALFGLGSVVGMAALSGLAGLGMARLFQKPRLAHALLMCTGVLSVGTGLAWGAASIQQLIGA